MRLKCWGLDFDATALMEVCSPAKRFSSYSHVLADSIQFCIADDCLYYQYESSETAREIWLRFWYIWSGVVIYRNLFVEISGKSFLFIKEALSLTYHSNGSRQCQVLQTAYLIYLIVTAVILAAGRIILKHMDYNTGRAGREL